MAGTDDVLVITGAGGVARRLGAGQTVVLADLDTDLLDRAVTALAADGHRAVGVELDVSDPASVRRVAASGRISFAGGRGPCGGSSGRNAPGGSTAPPAEVDDAL